MFDRRRLKYSIFPSIVLMFSILVTLKLPSKGSSEVTAEEPIATCVGIANDENNNKLITTGGKNVYHTLLKYDVDLGDKENTVNVVSTTGQGILLSGVKLSEIPGAIVDYAHGTKYLKVQIPQEYQDSLGDNPTLEVISGTKFENYFLDNVRFTLSNNKWQKINPVDFVSIKWNEIDYDFYGGKKGVLLEFSGNLSNKSTEYNGGIRSTNFASTVGKHIMLGEAKLSDLPGALVSYYQLNLMFVYADCMAAYRTLKIEEGTIFLDSSLPEVKLSYDASSKWNTNEKTYNSLTFSAITWNNLDYDYYGGRKGVLLSFDKNLSDVSNEFNGGIKANNLYLTVGDHIYLGGAKLSSLPGAFIAYHAQNYIFIYADDMSMYRTLRIESGAKFLDSSLPEVNLSFNGTDLWCLKPMEYSPVDYVKVEWNNIDYDFYGGKKGILINFSESLSNVAYEFNGNVKSTNLVSLVGNQIHLGGVNLSDLPGALVSYYQLNFLFIYADNMISYRTLEIENGLHLLDSTLPEVKLYANSSSLWTAEKTAKAPVSYRSIIWNNIGYGVYEGKNGILIDFDKNLSVIQTEIDGAVQEVNYARVFGEHIFIGDTKVSQLENAIVAYFSTSYLFIYDPSMTEAGVLTIEECEFFDSVLPSIEFYFRNGSWTTTYVPVEEIANCLGIANDENNNKLIDISGGKKVYHNLLRYDVDLGTAANTVNVVSTTGEGILLSGVKLSEIPGAIVDYAHGTVFLKIQIPQEYQDSLTGEITLEVLEGTHFESKVLDYVKFVLRNGQWAPYKKPEAVNFSTILWNNTGRDVFEGKNGVLLSYSNKLSNVPNEDKGGMKEVNLISEPIGSKIKLDGTSLKDISGAEVMYYGSSFLWVYAPNMDSYNELVVESCEIFTSVLPETHFAMFDGLWAESFKLTHIINGVKKVEYCKKNNSVVLDEQYYANLFNENNLDIKLVSFKVGDKIYRENDSLTVNKDTEVITTLLGFETTSGAAIKMTDPSNMRFESKVSKDDYDYLIKTFGVSNVETGTFIVSKSSLGLNDFNEFVNTPSGDYRKIVNSSFVNTLTAETDGFYKYFGQLDGIDSSKRAEEYIGIGYIKITDGLDECVVFADNEITSHSRSVYEVAKRAYSNYDIGSAPSLALDDYFNETLSLVTTDDKIEIENPCVGYKSPYTLSYNESSGEYQVSGSSVIKNVLMNGKKISEDSQVVVNVGGVPNKLINYDLDVSEGKSMLKFKLSPMAKASTLVDFMVEVPSNREMRILQITDTQIIDSSQKRTEDRLNPVATSMWSRGTLDKNCLTHIKELVDKENPDLILFTGDIVYGEFDDSGIILTEIINFMESLNVPWAPVFGNHDNESKMGVNWQCEQFENAQNCLFKKGELSGNGNYSIGLIDDSGAIKRVIYMLDSKGCLEGPGLATDQINWIKNVSLSVSEAYEKAVPGFACFHIPSVDFKNAYMNKYGYAADEKFNLDNSGIDGDFGQKNENMSLFNASLEATFKEANIDGVFAGHDHVNNFSILYNGIRYTYGTKTGIYDYYNSSILGGTLIKLKDNNAFEVSHAYLNENEMLTKPSLYNKATIMSDIHHDLNDYGGFYCTKSLAKLRKIFNETLDSKFFVALGDDVNSMVGSFNNYLDVMGVMKEAGLNIYNSTGFGYVEGSRMMYNLLGNHEVAYTNKSEFTDYVPFEEGIGSCGVFKRDDLMFVAVDALFTRGDAEHPYSDDPADILPCTEFAIPDKEFNWLKAQVNSQMDGSVKGIVWISHVALQDIDVTSKTKLLNELKGYNLPMTVFEGHTHVEKYQELKDETGKVYCKVYTLPAVTLYENYPYYTVIFKNGEPWCVDKHNGEIK